MIFRYSIVIVIALVAIALPAQQREPDTVATPSSAGDQPQGSADGSSGETRDKRASSTMSVPDEISGDYTPLTSTSESSRRASTINGAIVLAGIYDDDPFRSGNGRVRLAASPKFAVQYARARTVWTTDYAGELNFNQQTRTATHQLRSEIVRSMRRHLELSLRQVYAVASNPFTQLDEHLYAAGADPVQVSPHLLSSTATSRTAEIGGDLNWRTGRNSSVVVGGNASVLRFANEGEDSLVSNHTFDVRARYTRKVASLLTVGASAQFQAFEYPDDHAYTRLQTVQYFNVFELSKRWEVSFYGGPQHTDTRTAAAGLVLNSTAWFLSGGAAVTWRTPHFSARLTTYKTVTNGGGLTRADRSEVARVEADYQFAPRWRAEFSGGVTNNRVLQRVISGPDRFRTYEARVHVERQIRRDVWVSAAYQYLCLLQSGGAPVNRMNERNRAEVGIGYGFTRRWGR